MIANQRYGKQAMTDDMEAAVREALRSTRAVTVCPFHPEVTIRIGDDAAETHASHRLANIAAASWDHGARLAEMARQLGECADGVCPKCAAARP
jgi:hypothetical protein